MSGWVQIALAAVLNIATAYCINASNGMKHPWFTLGAILTIIPVQFLIANIVAGGGQLSQAIIFVVVAVVVGSAVIDIFAGKQPSPVQWVGFLIAVVGVAVATWSAKTA
jgi:drug/metabolite transporter (DMT)-like permease